MNQSFKSEIYQLGTDEQASFIIKNAGLNEIEQNVFWAWRNGYEDIDIAGHYFGGNEKKLKAAERKIRMKIAIAVFDCISFRMMYIDKISKN